MHGRLFSRELGDVTHQAFSTTVTSGLLSSFAASPQHRFDGGEVHEQDEFYTSRREAMVAHRAGIKALAIDKFYGKL
jgi:hypothetical protein